MFVERPGNPGVPRDHEPGAQREHPAIEKDDLLARGVEADRVVDRGTDRARGAGPFGLDRDVGLEHVLPLLHANAKPERGAVVLAVVDGPAPGCSARPIEDLIRAARTAKERLPIRVVGAQAVLEPCRVDRLVEGVHIDRLVGGIDREDLGNRSKEAVVETVPGERRNVRPRGAGNVPRLLFGGTQLAADGGRIEVGVAGHRIAEGKARSRCATGKQ